jgi:predicted alpha/beta hydrolase family esterase
LLQNKFRITLFDQISTKRINFQTLLVGSTNDQWASIERAEYYAAKWGSKFINIGAAGHINDLSGFGEWKEGLEILYSLS